MGDRTTIAWTDATWTPIRARRMDTGKVGVHCERVSEGCKNCYAATFNQRNLPVHGTGLDFTILNREKVEIFVDDEMLLAPIRWKRPRRIFVCSQTDLFGEFVSDAQIDQVFAAMALCPQHTFQVLTKRPQRMRQWVTNDGNEDDESMRDRMDEAAARNFEACHANMNPPERWPLPNVWLGVTAENQARADERIPLLLQTPAAKRFVSVEPMLGPVDLFNAGMKLDGKLNRQTGERAFLHWVICGGESSQGARPMHPDWVRSLRDQCQAAAVPFLHKQNGEWAPGETVDRTTGIVETARLIDDQWFFGKESLARTDGHVDDQPDVYRVGKKAAGRLLDGREWNQFPEVTP